MDFLVTLAAQLRYLDFLDSVATLTYVTYSSKENDAIYDVEYAVWNNQLLGGFYVTSPIGGLGEFTSITTFDGDLNLLNTLYPEDLGFDAFQGIVVEKHHLGRYNQV